jgi:glycine hydroxymethyltransferase
MSWARSLQEADPTIAALIAKETARQEHGLELIASENFVSPAVLEALGTTLTNKYAEGYPGKRYYGGCEIVDQVEDLARQRCCELFKAEHANVQPHSGSSANLAAYLAVLRPGAKLMGLALPHGGHLTHGSPVNFSGQLFDVVAYGVEESTGRIDMDRVREVARRERPNMIIAGGSAYPRTFDFAVFAEIAREIDAMFLVDMAHFAGLVAGGVHPNPMEHAQVVTSTAHKTLRGPRGGFVICRQEFAKQIDKSIFPGHQGGPLEHVIAAKAVAFREALDSDFKQYARQIVDNAVALGEALSERGFDLVSGGTDTHVLLVDLRSKDLTGKAAEEALGQACIHVNKNTVPGDQRSPFVTSGIRLGTPALTTRGMREEEMSRIGGLVADILADPGPETVRRVAGEVRELATAFPLYAAETAAS